MIWRFTTVSEERYARIMMSNILNLVAALTAGDPIELFIVLSSRNWCSGVKVDATRKLG